MSKSSEDMVGIAGWNKVWERRDRKNVRTLTNSRLYGSMRLRTFFEQNVPPKSRLLEVGCGGSKTLPFFAHRLGCECWGIDYSPQGVELCSQYLSYEGVQGNIVLGDIFQDQEIPEAYFNVVYSGGLIEHFQNTADVVARIARYARSGGRVITLIPNMQGLIGSLHWTADPDLYYQHLIITPAKLDALHVQNGLKIVQPAAYFGTFALAVVNFNRIRNRLPALVDYIAWRALKVSEECICLPFRIFNLTPETHHLSPFVVGVYER